ncbi:cytochrome P450 CYP736A12-like [Punica granatum]|uniref:Cytochrome P450 CYP736A12-like n=4 Tax=Punica granatum TaxID=22663 RepID=A0A6P8DEG0_PUNGR|nr:cytochrome P450 CYP736A12-like [Punica granatum]
MGPYHWQAWTAILLLVISYLWRKKTKTAAKRKGVKLPPGPRGLPILGSLLALGENPHHDLHKLAQKYGPIMHLRLGFVPAIVVSSPEAAEQFLKTHDLVFASRPLHEAAWYISWEQSGLSFAPYGAYWRNARKMCVLELLSAHKIGSFRAMRREEVGLMVESLRVAARDGATVDVTSKVSALSTDMSCLMVFGKKYMDEELDEKGFKGVIQEGMQLGATPNMGDYIPYVGALDLQRLKKRMKRVRKVYDAFFEKIIDEHVQNPKREGESKDFIDVMLRFLGSEEVEYRIDRNHIKAIILDMLAGSMDTSATAIEWAMAELMRNPCVMQKVQDELEKVVGLDRPIEESDLENLNYLDMVIKESLRLHPVAPLLLPHEAIEDCTINGFHIPRKSRVIVNTYAIGRDPSVWPNPELFWPERFEGSDVDIRGRDFQLIPFGSGRRGCPGLQLGLTVVKFVLAQLVHCFKWELPGGMLPKDLDMTEEFGLTAPRAKHLLAIPSYRLKALCS